MIVFLVRYAVFPFRGCSKSPIKMTRRISDVMLFRSSRIKCIRSGTGSYAASNFSVLFILLFEHALLDNLLLRYKQYILTTNEWHKIRRRGKVSEIYDI